MRPEGTTPSDSSPVTLPPTCRIVSSHDTAEWDSVLRAISPETQFLCRDWPLILRKTYGYETFLAVAKQGEEIIGVLPYTVVKSFITGTRAVSLPFFDICRSYHSEASTVALLYETIVSQGRKEGWDYFELRGDIEHLPIETPSLSFYNHVVDLSVGPKAAFANLASSARRAIRKAEKDGVEIEKSQDLEAMRHFYRLQCITRRRHGLPPQPFSFFKTIHGELIAKGKGLIILAKVDGHPVAASVYLEQGSTVHYKYGASDLSFQNSRCNNLVMWTAIEHYASLGFYNLDLGRNSLNAQGLRKYKQSWGSKESLTHYHRVNLKSGDTMQMSDDVYGWHNKIFGVLPITLTKLAGTLLYKHIA